MQASRYISSDDPNRKPFGQVEVDPDQKHVFADLYRRGARDLVSGEDGVITTTSGTGVDAALGLKIRGGTSTSNGGKVAYPTGAVLATTGYSVILKATLIPASPVSGGDVLTEKPFTSAAEPFYAFQIKRSRTGLQAIAIQMTIGGARRTTLNAGPTSALSANTEVFICLGIKPGLQTLYTTLGGIEYTGTTTISGDANDYATDLTVGASALFPTLGSLSKDIHYFRIVDRHIGLEQARHIAMNEYQFLKVAPPLRLVLPTAAAPSGNVPIMHHHYNTARNA